MYTNESDFPSEFNPLVPLLDDEFDDVGIRDVRDDVDTPPAVRFVGNTAEWFE